jgi:hypothetical protein
VPGTLERIARMAAAGRLDAKTANVLLLAATSAGRALEAAEERRKAEAEQREREARMAAAAKAQAEWESTYAGQLEKRALDAMRVDQARMPASLMGVS